MAAVFRKRAKYSNKKTEADGLVFDSRAEAGRWLELRIMERQGMIADLQRQVRYELAPSVKFTGSTRAKPALCYWADFVYVDVATGKKVTEDTKGVETEAYRIKKHLMLSIHGIEILDRIKAR